MSKVSWNKEQLAAIESVGGNTLVSASAGSGKTSVMIERVVRLIKRGTPVRRIVMLTFSNAVAAELRERITAELTKALREEGADREYLRRQIDDVPMADIGTVHSFCGGLIKEFFEQAGVDPSYTLYDEKEKAGAVARAIDEALEEYGESADRDAETLRLYFGSDRGLRAAVLAVMNYLEAQPDREAWLAACDADYGIGSRLREEYLGRLCRRAEEVARFAEDAAEYLEVCGFDAENVKVMADIARACGALAACGGTDDLYKNRALFSADPALKPKKRNENSPEYLLGREKQTRAGKAFKDLCKDVTEITDTTPEEWEERSATASRYARKLAEIAAKASERYAAIKQADNRFDFSDLEYYAIKILRDESARNEISSRYDHVCIDEYQDTNYVQEFLLGAVSNGSNAFMVGDPKQSIYGFRLTEIGIFVNKFDEYRSAPEKGVALTLNSNYRSDKRILDFVNTVFGRLMTKDRGGIDYAGTSVLTTDAPVPDGGEAVEIAVFAREDKDKSYEFPADGVYSVREDGESGSRRTRCPEAEGIADMISETIGKPIIPVSREGGEMRGVRYGDIAILCFSRSDRVEEIAAELARRGIPVDASGLKREKDEPAVERLIDMFKAIDNPRRDVELVSVMLSAFGGFTHEEVALVRSAYPDEKFFWSCAEKYALKDDALGRKLSNFYATLGRYALFACQNDAAALADRLVADLDYDKFVTAAEGAESAAALSFFIDSMRGKNFAATLQSAVAYFDETDHGVKSAERSAGRDSVKIMTVHASKGLEFPIVFSVDSDHRFMHGDSGDMTLDRTSGIVLGCPDPHGRLKLPTLESIAAKERVMTAEREEKIRLCYVAFTRAKTRLIITGMKKKPEEFGGATGRNSVFDCIEEVCAAENGFKDRYVKTYPLSEGDRTEEREIRRPVFSDPDPAAERELERCLYAEYPYAESTRVALKHTVTGLNASAEEPSRPHFAEETSVSGWFGGESAARGTAYHKVLEKLDYDLTDIAEINAALDDMYEKGVLTFGEREELDADVLLGCLKSDVIMRARRNEHWREKQFMLCVPANELFGGCADDKVLVQGTVDLVIFDKERGQTVLVDFKKSSLPSDELKRRYGRQLELYAYAIEKGLKVKVDRKCLFVLGRNEEIDV